MVKHSSYDRDTDTLRTDSTKYESWEECTHIDHSEKGSNTSGDAHVITTVDNNGNVDTNHGD